MIAQELLLFENSGSDDLEDFVDSAFSKARITVKLPYLDAMDYVVLLEEINKTGIGPQGMGGRITAFAVHINMMPCHISSLPVAVNLQCHSHRAIKIDL